MEQQENYPRSVCLSSRVNIAWLVWTVKMKSGPVDIRECQDVETTILCENSNLLLRFAMVILGFKIHPEIEVLTHSVFAATQP